MGQNAIVESQYSVTLGGSTTRMDSTPTTNHLVKLPLGLWVEFGIVTTVKGVGAHERAHACGKGAHKRKKKYGC